MLALAVLLARTAGLHFHVAEAHHDPAEEGAHAAGMLSVPQSVMGLESDHLLDHLAGAQDVDSSAAPASTMSKTIPLLVIVAFMGMVWLLTPSRKPQRLVWAPFRPPRLRSHAELLPPSQGPPLAA